MRSVILSQPEISFEQYLTHDDGTDDRYELVNGALEKMPPPTGLHAEIVDYLVDAFKNEIKHQKLAYYVRYGNLGVRTGIKSCRLPDLLIITELQRQAVRYIPAVLETPPILAIEVVSPDHPQRDYQDKKQEYARVGIPEYWIVDPIAAQVLIFVLITDQYQQVIYEAGQMINSPTFPALKITVTQILQAE